VFAARGDVLIAGDFNARPDLTTPASSRWRSITNTVLDGGLFVVANPTGENGTLRPTRRDPATGAETVLDLVLVGGATEARTDTAVDAANVISDHFPMVVGLSFPPLPGPTGDVPNAKYGLCTPVPRHLRRKPKVVASREGEQVQRLKAMVDAGLAQSQFGAGPSQDLTTVETVVLSAAYAAGLCVDTRGGGGDVRVFTRLQRRLDNARRRLAVAQAAAVVAGADAEARVAEAKAALVAAAAAKQVSYPDRRRVLRARAASTVREVNEQLQQWWIRGDVGLLARRMTADQLGLLSARSHRTHTPLWVRQVELRRREEHLREKYGSAPPTDWTA